MIRAAARISAAALLLAALLANGAVAAQMPAPTLAPSPSSPLSGQAAGGSASGTTAPTTDPNALATPPSPSIPPPGRRLTSKRAIALAERVPKIERVRREHPGSYPTAYTKGTAQWQVSVFTARDRREVGQVTIDDASGAVLEAWTGYQVPWTMARGYDGAFGRRVNAWYVWIPLCVMFLVPFLAPARPGGTGLRRFRPSWLHLDLLVLLGFSVSLAFFNAARVGLSTPLIYPLLGYLLIRMLVVAKRGGRTEPLRLLVPVSWLAIGLVFLIGFRVGLNVTNSNVIDVGYSGVIGADRLIGGQPLYASDWPRDNASGDTYGPVNYYAYVPFEQIWPWSGKWDDLPAAHAAAVFFDLLTIGMLFLLGRRIRGPSLGIVLAYAWAAFPFTLYASSTNSNDALVALLLVAALLVAGRPLARGATVALAGLTKLAPLALAPLFARTPRETGPPARRPVRPAEPPAAGAGLVRRLRARVRAHRDACDAAGRPRRRSAHLLGPHDRVPARPRVTLLDLGTVERPRRAAARRAGRGGAARTGRRRVAASSHAHADGGLWRGRADRAPARARLLVLPLRRVVPPARARRAARAPRRSAGAGA